MTQNQQKNNKSLKILQVISTPPFAWATGGCARIVFDLSKELVKQGHEVTILTTDMYKPNQRYYYQNPEIIEGIKIIRYKYINDNLAWNKKIYISPGMIKYLKKNIREYDIVHLEDLISVQAIVTAKLCKKNNIPYVLTVHGSLTWLKQKGILNLLYLKFGLNIIKNASKLIALNDIEREQYIQLGINPELIEIVPNAVDYRTYVNLPPYGSFRKKYGLKDEKIILYLGRINKIKGIDLLLDAFSLMRKENKILIIIGPDEGFLDELKNKSRNLGIERHILFIDPLFGKEKLEAYVDANIYVLPSRYEMFPLTVIESWACGTPVIVTEKCAISSFIGESGKVSKFNKNSLKDAIVEMLNDKTKNASFSGREKVKQIFDIQITAKQMGRIYGIIAKEKESVSHNISNK